MVGVLAVGCNDLDTEPLGGTITSAQKEQVLADNPDMAEAGVNALPAGLRLYGYNSSLYGKSLHNDFGFPSMALGLDSRGTDLIGPNTGYNWYSAQASFADWGGTYFANLIYWNTCYSLIKSANTVASTITPDTDNPELQYFLGQSLCYRALCYYYLANMYQLTYAHNPDAPCVPILTPENMVDAAVNGNPRATVAQVWQQVVDDCTLAIDLLEKAAQAGNVRPDKRFVDASVVYGLRARAYLTTEQWALAEADAQKAIQLASAQGIRPYTIAESSVPGFYKLTNPNYMWGIEQLSSMSYTQGVANFASMLCCWMPNGYGAVCPRTISKKLYAAIPATDSRKNWWLNENGDIPATLPSAYAAYLNNELGDAGKPPYTNVKFAAADNDPGKPNGAVDFPMMRIEEMYLILAEAQGMQSPSTGAATLQSFVKTYRNPNYSCTLTDKNALRNEVWLQRRIEFWGEGLSYFDIMRLQKGIDRRGCGFDVAWVFVIDPEDPVMRYQITQEEAQTNSLIGDVTEGADWVTPTPVADVE